MLGRILAAYILLELGLYVHVVFKNVLLCLYSWRLEYFKKQFRQWFEPQLTRKIEIAKKRLNLEISATEEMVLMSICDQLHKVKTCKYYCVYPNIYHNNIYLFP